MFVGGLYTDFLCHGSLFFAFVFKANRYSGNDFAGKTLIKGGADSDKSNAHCTGLWRGKHQIVAGTAVPAIPVVNLKPSVMKIRPLCIHLEANYVQIKEYV